MALFILSVELSFESDEFFADFKIDLLVTVELVLISFLELVVKLYPAIAFVSMFDIVH